jgi:hypothetical protein
MFVYKTDSDADTFYKVYRRHRKDNPNAKFLIHFRISTHGTITEDNLHPFIINDNVALIHNGTVDLADHKYGDQRSDTRFLCEEFLAKLPEGWHLSEGVHSFIKEVSGWSKFIVLDLDNNHAIINGSAGHWDDKENWFSNSSYKQVSQYIDYGGKQVKRTTSTPSTKTSSTSTSTPSKTNNKSYKDWEDYLLDDTYDKADLYNPFGSDNRVLETGGTGLVRYKMSSVLDIENYLHKNKLTTPPKGQSKRYGVGLDTDSYVRESIWQTDVPATSICDYDTWYYLNGKSHPNEYGCLVVNGATVFALGGSSGSKAVLIYPCEIVDLYLVGAIVKTLNTLAAGSAIQDMKTFSQAIDDAIVMYFDDAFATA